MPIWKSRLLQQQIAIYPLIELKYPHSNRLILNLVEDHCVANMASCPLPCPISILSSSYYNMKLLSFMPITFVILNLSAYLFYSQHQVAGIASQRHVFFSNGLLPHSLACLLRQNIPVAHICFVHQSTTFIHLF